MTKERCIADLKGSMELFLFNPNTGETIQPEQLNDMDRMTYEAMKAAVEFLEETSEINEAKKRIVIENYFKRDCDINTSIRQAYENGFERGLQKAPARKAAEEKPQGMIPIDSYYVELWLKSEIDAAKGREMGTVDTVQITAAGAQKAALGRVLEKVERWKGKTGLYEV